MSNQTSKESLALERPVDDAGRKLLTNAKVRVAGYGLIVAIALGLPFLVTNSYYFGVVVYMVVISNAVLGLNLILGYTGLLSLGQAAFFGIGAYTTAILMVHYHWPFLPSFMASALTSLLAALLLAIPARRVRGDYFCLLTIAFGEIFQLATQGWISFTGGAMGIVAIPVPKVFGFTIGTPVDFYYLGLILLAFTLVTMAMIVNSRLGRALVAVREDELAAQTMGINSAVFMIMAFAVGSLYAGLAGSLLAVYETTVSTASFGIDYSCLLCIMVIVGGMGRLWAPLVGVVVMTMATEIFRPLAAYRMMIIGSIMILVLLFRPQGIFGISAFKD